MARWSLSPAPLPASCAPRAVCRRGSQGAREPGRARAGRRKPTPSAPAENRFSRPGTAPAKRAGSGSWLLRRAVAGARSTSRARCAGRSRTPSSWPGAGSWSAELGRGGRGGGGGRAFSAPLCLPVQQPRGWGGKAAPRIELRRREYSFLVRAFRKPTLNIE